MSSHSTPLFAQGLGLDTLPVDEQTIAQIAIEAARGLEKQADDEGSVGSSVTAALKKLGSMISGFLDDCLTQLSTAMGSESNAVADARSDVAAKTKVVEETSGTLQQNKSRLKEIHLQLETGTGTVSKFGLPRSIPTAFYAGLLVVASVAVATFNVPSLRVLGLSDSLIVLVAAVIAGLYGTAIHLLPRGIGDNNERGFKFWLSVAILLLQLLSTILLATLRQDYLVILEVSIEPWGFIALPLLADAVALLASFLHEGDAATALRRVGRRVEDSKADLEEAEELLREAEKRVSEARERRFTLVDCGIRQIHKIHDDGAKAVLHSFIMKLLTLRPMKASLLQNLELPVHLPDGLPGYEEWLVDEGEKLNRPVRTTTYAIHVIGED